MSLHSELSSRADLDEFSSLAFNFFVPRACSCGINCAFPIAAVATSVKFTEMLVDAVAVWATTPALTEDFAGAVLLSASVSVTVSVTSAALWKDFVADTTFPAPVRLCFYFSFSCVSCRISCNSGASCCRKEGLYCLGCSCVSCSFNCICCLNEGLCCRFSCGCLCRHLLFVLFPLKIKICKISWLGLRSVRFPVLFLVWGRKHCGICIFPVFLISTSFPISFFNCSSHSIHNMFSVRLVSHACRFFFFLLPFAARLAAIECASSWNMSLLAVIANSFARAGVAILAIKIQFGCNFFQRRALHL